MKQRKLVDLVKLARIQKLLNNTNENLIPSLDFIDLINSKGRIIYLNEGEKGMYSHKAEYKGFIFTAKTRRKIYDL